VEEYFAEHDLYQKYPIEKREIYFDHDNALFFNQTLDALQVSASGRGVPTVVMGETVLVGDQLIITQFIQKADVYLGDENQANDEPVAIEASEAKAPVVDDQVEDAAGETADGFDLTLAAVVGASIVDAINPCAFAVLIILMTTILASGNGKKALKSGFAFAASIFISYFLMGLGLYTALGMGNLSGVLFRIVGWLAILLGLLNLKDFFWYGKGFLMEVPMSWRPQLKRLIASVSSPLGAFGIGFLVSLFLLPCTSGPYIVILGMLAKKSQQLQAVLYLLLYNLIFVLPMILITLAVYKGFDPAKAEALRQKQLRLLHLIAGIIMLGMGSVILLGWI